MSKRKQRETGSRGTGRGGRCGRVSRVAVLIGIALFVCLLTVSFAGTASAQQTISSANDLDDIRNDLGGDYVLTSDIDMNNYNGDFSPIGANAQGDRFIGTLDGQGYEIKNLDIDENSRNVGLFAAAGTANTFSNPDTVIKDLGIVNAKVTGDAPTGILIGVTDDGQTTAGQSVNITNVYVEGTVTGGPRGSFSEPEEGAGGLIGYAGAGVNEVEIRASHAIVDVNATGVGDGDKGTAGGLVGVADFDVLIEDSWSDGSVRIDNTGQDAFVQVGGVVGNNVGGNILNSFSIADVFGDSGGLGSSASAVGGVVGSNQEKVTTSFAAGSVSANSVDNVSGLIGENIQDFGTATGSYWDTQATGQNSGIGGGNTSGVTGLTTSEMQDTSASANMVDFSFPDEWRERPNDYPVPAGVFPASVVGTNEPISSGEAVIDLNVAYSGPGSINNFDVGILIDGGIDGSGRHTDSISINRNGETTTTLTNDNVGSSNADLDVQYLDPQTWTIIQDTLQVESSPTADAGGPYTVNEGGSVTLDGTGSSDPDGSIVAYRWDLNNDGSTDATGSTTTFDASSIDGTTSQTVTLEVEDDSGETANDSTTVDVLNVAPSVSADNDPVVVNEGQTATNTGSYSDPVDSVSLSASTGTVTDDGSGGWSWSYPTSDGPDDSEAVTITADDGEDTSSVSFDLTVNNVAPDVTIDSLPGSADEGDTVTLDASFSDPGSDTHTATVDWGDGTTTALSESEVDQTNDELSASHTYADNASYTVTVTVTDDDGGSGSDSKIVDVANVAPDVTIDSLPSTADEGDTVTLDASFSDPGSDDTHTATVDWGDGTTESVSVDQTNDELSATHTYADNGSYTVTVTVEDDDGGTDTTSGNVDVANVPPDVTIDSLPGSANEGDVVNLDASFDDPGTDDTHTATVDWGDGTTESVSVDQTNDELSSSHTYADNGSYTVTVTVEDDDGGADTTSGNVDVANAPPDVTIDSLPGSADEGDLVSLDASFSDPGSDTHSATVDWGDGTTESVGVDQTNNTLSSSHTYADNGSYTVTVTVTDDDGGTGTTSGNVDVANVPPEVTIDSLPSTSEEAENVTLNASFSDPGTADTHTATVDWGDETTEPVSVNQTNDTLSATHAYAEGGIYTVTVTVEDDDGATGSAEGTVDVQAGCLNPREVGRGQEDEECPRDRTIRRGGSRENLDRETGRRSDTRRRDRGRGR